MKSTHSLRRQLRALWVTNLVLFAAVCIAATPAVRPLLLDTSNHPTENVDFASTHWTGDPTSGKAIAPLSVTTPTLNTSGAMTFSATLGYFFNNGNNSDFTIGNNQAGRVVVNFPLGLQVRGGPLGLGATYSQADVLFNRVATGSASLTDASGNAGSLTLGNLTASGYISFDGGLGYSDGVGDLALTGALSTVGGGYFDQRNNGGYISTNNGGYVDTSNGGGHISTNGNISPTDSNAPVGSLWMDQQGHNGHVLWVKETTGWVGK